MICTPSVKVAFLAAGEEGRIEPRARDGEENVARVP